MTLKENRDRYRHLNILVSIYKELLQSCPKRALKCFVGRTNKDIKQTKKNIKLLLR